MDVPPAGRADTQQALTPTSPTHLNVGHIHRNVDCLGARLDHCGHTHRDVAAPEGGGLRLTACMWRAGRGGVRDVPSVCVAPTSMISLPSIINYPKPYSVCVAPTSMISSSSPVSKLLKQSTRGGREPRSSRSMRISCRTLACSSKGRESKQREGEEHEGAGAGRGARCGSPAGS